MYGGSNNNNNNDGRFHAGVEVKEETQAHILRYGEQTIRSLRSDNRLPCKIGHTKKRNFLLIKIHHNEETKCARMGSNNNNNNNNGRFPAGVQNEEIQQ